MADPSPKLRVRKLDPEGHRFEVWCTCEQQFKAEGPREDALRELEHHAAMFHLDGPWFQ